MVRTLFYALLFLSTMTLPAFAWESYVGKTMTCVVENIEPGNTLMVRDEDRTYPLRFYGIGIPTMKQPFGAEAHAELLKFLPRGSKIIVTTINEDEEGLINALVQYNDHSVNNMLVDKGLAWVDRKTCKAFFCRRWHIQEHLAVEDRRGIWSLNLSSPPWQWSE